ncbi:MAG: hypothetical protein AAF993_01010 [Pseudomonadota bacterium]
MNWDAIGAIGELIGALAVVLTLAYLAVQVKGAKRAMVSSVYQARSDISSRSTETLYNSDYLPEIFAKLFFTESPTPLSDAETHRFILFIQNQHRIFENLNFQVIQGILDETAMQAHVNSLKTSFFFDNDLARWHWENVARNTVDEHYRGVVDSVFSTPPTHRIMHLTFFKDLDSTAANVEHDTH